MIEHHSWYKGRGQISWGVKGEALASGSELLALLGCLIILFLGVLFFASLKVPLQLLGWCKPFVHVLKIRTLETTCV